MRSTVKFLATILIALPGVMSATSSSAEEESRQQTVHVEGKRIRHSTMYYDTNYYISPDYSSLNAFQDSLLDNFGEGVNVPEPEEPEQCEELRSAVDELDAWINAVDGNVAQVIISGDRNGTSVEVISDNGSTSVTSSNDPLTIEAEDDIAMFPGQTENLINVRTRMLEGSITYNYAGSSVRIQGLFEISTDFGLTWSQYYQDMTLPLQFNDILRARSTLLVELFASGCSLN